MDRTSEARRLFRRRTAMTPVGYRRMFQRTQPT